MSTRAKYEPANIITMQNTTIIVFSRTRADDQGIFPDFMSTRWQSGASIPRPVCPRAPKSETSNAMLFTAIVASTQKATKARRCTTQRGTFDEAAPAVPLISRASATSGSGVAGTLGTTATCCAELRESHCVRMSEAGSSCNGYVKKTAAVTKTLDTCSTNFSDPLERVAKKAITEAVCSSPRKAIPQVTLKLRNARVSAVDAKTTTFGKADGRAISFSTGRTRPKPSKEKKTLEASISASATGRLDQAPAAMPARPISASLHAPQTEPETKATLMAKVPRTFR
mmetsp:Transcript_107934/g.315615  ORF Transcript_107934/g.315615 Transcript_107934/m.315615 type:complete len:284 (-) Transcript_107934:530-1381(-)